MTRSRAATASANRLPRARSAPWWTCTRSCGANRAASRCQLPTSDIGQTSRLGPAPRRGRPSLGEQREQLHRLAEAHVVGEDAAESGAVQEVEPGQAALLVRAQLAVEQSGTGIAASRCSASPGQQFAEPAVGLDLLDRQPSTAFGPTRDAEAEPQQLADRRLPSADELRPAASRAASSSIHWPRSRTSGALRSASRPARRR